MEPRCVRGAGATCLDVFEDVGHHSFARISSEIAKSHLSSDSFRSREDREQLLFRFGNPAGRNDAHVRFQSVFGQIGRRAVIENDACSGVLLGRGASE